MSLEILDFEFKPPPKRQFVSLVRSAEKSDLSQLRETVQFAQFLEGPKYERDLLTPNARADLSRVIFRRLIGPMSVFLRTPENVQTRRLFVSHLVHVWSEMSPRGQIELAVDNLRMDFGPEDIIAKGTWLSSRIENELEKILIDSVAIEMLQIFHSALCGQDDFPERELSFGCELYVNFLRKQVSLHHVENLLSATPNLPDVLNKIILPTLKSEAALLAGLTLDGPLLRECERCRASYPSVSRARAKSPTCSDGCGRRLATKLEQSDKGKWNGRKRSYYRHAFAKFSKSLGDK